MRNVNGSGQLLEILTWLRGVDLQNREGSLSRPQMELARRMTRWVATFNQDVGGIANLQAHEIGELYRHYRAISTEFFARTVMAQVNAELATVNNRRTGIYNFLQQNPQYLDQQTNPNDFNMGNDPNDEQLGILRDFLANNQTQRGGGYM